LEKLLPRFLGSAYPGYQNALFFNTESKKEKENMGSGRCPKCCDWVDIDETGHCKVCGTTVAQPQVYVIDHDLVFCLCHGNVKPNAYGGCSVCLPDSILASFMTA
jgi:hypothetical protein